MTRGLVTSPVDHWCVVCNRKIPRGTEHHFDKTKLERRHADCKRAGTGQPTTASSIKFAAPNASAANNEED